MPPHNPAHTGTHTYQPGPKGKLEPLDQAHVRQDLSRLHLRHLTAPELRVLDAILDCTVAWQRPHGDTSIPQLAKKCGRTDRQVREGLRRLRIAA